jgi:hypothetical protein
MGLAPSGAKKSKQDSTRQVDSNSTCECRKGKSSLDATIVASNGRNSTVTFGVSRIRKAHHETRLSTRMGGGQESNTR